MNEKLVEAVTLVILQKIGAAFHGDLARQVARELAQAAIAAHSAFLKEAARRADVVEAGGDEISPFLSEWSEWHEIREDLPGAFRAMLDQIGRTPDAT